MTNSWELFTGPSHYVVTYSWTSYFSVFLFLQSMAVNADDGLEVDIQRNNKDYEVNWETEDEGKYSTQMLSTPTSFLFVYFHLTFPTHSAECLSTTRLSRWEN